MTTLLYVVLLAVTVVGFAWFHVVAEDERREHRTRFEHARTWVRGRRVPS